MKIFGCWWYIGVLSILNTNFCDLVNIFGWWWYNICVLSILNTHFCDLVNIFWWWWYDICVLSILNKCKEHDCLCGQPVACVWCLVCVFPVCMCVPRCFPYKYFSLGWCVSKTFIDAPYAKFLKIYVDWISLLGLTFEDSLGFTCATDLCRLRSQGDWPTFYKIINQINAQK